MTWDSTSTACAQGDMQQDENKGGESYWGLLGLLGLLGLSGLAKSNKSSQGSTTNRGQQGR